MCVCARPPHNARTVAALRYVGAVRRETPATECGTHDIVRAAVGARATRVSLPLPSPGAAHTLSRCGRAHGATTRGNTCAGAMSTHTQLCAAPRTCSAASAPHTTVRRCTWLWHGTLRGTHVRVDERVHDQHTRLANSTAVRTHANAHICRTQCLEQTMFGLHAWRHATFCNHVTLANIDNDTL